MASSYHSTEISDIKRIKRIYGIQEENIISLIVENITNIDRKKYHNFPIGVTKQNMIKNIPFTEQFLNLINTERDKYTDSNELSFYSQIGNFLKSFNPDLSVLVKPSHIHEPANRIQFLFLANVYCNSKKYFADYEWLPQLLFSFEEAGLTGEFKINNRLYNTLFGDCHTAQTIKSDLPFFIKENDQITGPIYDMEFKTLSNTSLAQQVAKSDEQPNGWLTSQTQTQKRKRDSSEDKPECKYGKNCYRRNNPEHIHEFSHPNDETYAGGKKTRKRNKRSKTKRSKTKRSKTKRSKTKKRSKRNKYSKTNKRK